MSSKQRTKLQIFSRETTAAWLIFFCVFVVGVLLRLYKLGAVPLAPYWDEVAMLADARMLLETGLDLHGQPWNQAIFISYGDFKLPVYIWATTLAARMVGVNALAVRIPSAIAGISTMFISAGCAWFLCKRFASASSKTFRMTAAVATAGAVAITPWSIHFSRTGFEAHLSQAIAGLSVLIILITFHYCKSSLLQFIGLTVSTLVASLSIYTYFSTRFVIPVVVLAVVWLLFFTQSLELKKRIGLSLLATILCVSILGFSLTPMLRSRVYEQSTQYRLSTKSLLAIEPFVLKSNEWRTIAGDTIIDRVIFHRRLLQLLAIGEQISTHLSPNYLFFKGDVNLRHGTGQHGILLIATAPMLLIGISWALLKNRKIALIVGMWWILALLPASIPTEVPHALRSLNALIPTMLFIGIGFAALMEKTMLIKNRVLRAVVIAAACSIPFIESARYMQYYYRIYPTLSAASWQHGYQKLAELSYDWSTSHYVEIDSAEYRLLLWIYAFTDYPSSEIQAAIQEQGPFPTQLTHIRVRELEPDRIEYGQKPLLVVGTSATMELFEKNAVWKPRTVITIETANADAFYKALEYVQQ